MALDLYKIIDTLLEERNRIDRIIRTLETAVPQREERRGSQAASPREGRRSGRPGRKSMDAAERRVVAERMKRYWAGRRAGVEGSSPPPTTPAGPKS